MLSMLCGGIYDSNRPKVRATQYYIHPSTNNFSDGLHRLHLQMECSLYTMEEGPKEHSGIPVGSIPRVELILSRGEPQAAFGSSESPNATEKRSTAGNYYSRSG